MSERAIAFVESWVLEHVGAADAPVEGDDSRAKALAAQCLAAASANGISRAEIDAAFEDLTTFMAGEIEEANNREDARLAADDE